MVKTFCFDNVPDEFCSNSYVVGEKGGPCLVIDIGTTSTKIIDYIKENHTNCLGVLLTHGHFDHFKGLEKFLNEFNCTVFIDENDEKLLDDTRLNCSRMSYENVKINLNNIYLLTDEDEINFINKYYVKVIETPFHTDGSVCYLIKSENALFTGDTLFKGSIGRSDLPTGKSRLIKQSLKKILLLDKNLNIYPGHGEVSTLQNELKYNYYLKEMNHD